MLPSSTQSAPEAILTRLWGFWSSRGVRITGGKVEMTPIFSGMNTGLILRKQIFKHASMAKETIAKAIFEAFGKVGGVYPLISMILLNAIVVFSFIHHSPDSPHATGLFDIGFFIAFLLFVFVIVLFTLTFHKASSDSFLMLVALVEVFFLGIQLFFITRYEIYGLHTSNGITQHMTSGMLSIFLSSLGRPLDTET
jgi:hypothetical protein